MYVLYVQYLYICIIYVCAVIMESIYAIINTGL